MRFSIVIPTLNRTKELVLMLNSLKNQSLLDFEVIIVDQNKKDILKEHVDVFKKSLVIKHLRIPARGASNARNKAMKITEGEIITFPDDDCEYPNDFLKRIDKIFKENPVDGIVVNTMDRLDGKAIASLSSRDVMIKRANVLKTVIEAGIFIKNEIARNIRFDENLGVGSPSGYCSDEGPDFVLKLLNRGAKLKFYPDVKMYHPNPIQEYNEKTSLRAYNYGKGRGFFLRKNDFGVRSISFFLALYIGGMFKALILLDKKMFLYFINGFKGRYEGYFKS